MPSNWGMEEAQLLFVKHLGVLKTGNLLNATGTVCWSTIFLGEDESVLIDYKGDKG